MKNCLLCDIGELEDDLNSLLDCNSIKRKEVGYSNQVDEFKHLLPCEGKLIKDAVRFCKSTFNFT